MGTLSEANLEAFEEHLLACNSCQDQLLEMEAYVNAMRSASPKLRKARLPFWATSFQWPRPAWVVAFAMGLRNGTVRKLAVPDMTTTVLTLTLTGLASESRLAGGTDPRAARRLIAVLAMLLGAYSGAVLLRHHGIAWPLLISAAAVTVAAIGYRERG